MLQWLRKVFILMLEHTLRYSNHHSETHLKINHLAQWAYAQDDAEMLRMMHEARTNRKAVWSDRSARKKLFDREMYDRLFLND